MRPAAVAAEITLTEPQTHARMNELKVELLDIETQLGDESRKPPEDDKEKFAEWLVWRARAKRAHAMKRKQLFTLKAHLSRINTRVYEAVHATKTDYDPDNPDDLLAVALDLIQKFARTVYADGTSGDDEVRTAVADIRAYLGRKAKKVS